MDIINVIESIDGKLTVNAFPIYRKQSRDKLIAQAVDTFEKCIMENSASTSQEIDEFVEDGYFEKGDYKLYLIWSI